jgi:hypothetical protein
MLAWLASTQIGALAAGSFGTVLHAEDLRSEPHTQLAIKLVPRGDFVSDLLSRNALLYKISMAHGCES